MHFNLISADSDPFAEGFDRLVPLQAQNTRTARHQLMSCL
jgi:hypothetical protein